MVVVLDGTLLGTVDVTEGLKEEGTLLVNTVMKPGEMRETTGFDSGKAFTVDAGHIAIEESGRGITNTPMLGAFARATGLFDLEDMADPLPHRDEPGKPGIVGADQHPLRSFGRDGHSR